MVVRTRLLLSTTLCICAFPCLAQRGMSPSRGGVGHVPAMHHFGAAGAVGNFRSAGGYRSFTRPRMAYGYRPGVIGPMRFGGRFPQRPYSTGRNAIPGRWFIPRPRGGWSSSDIRRPFAPHLESPRPLSREQETQIPHATNPEATTGPYAPRVLRPSSSGSVGSSSLGSRPPSQFHGMSPFVLRPPTSDGAVTNYILHRQGFQAPTSRVLFSSRLSATRFLSTAFTFRPLFFPRQFLVSSFFFNSFLFPQPFFFSPFFASAFFFQESFFVSPFFASSFFFQPPFFFASPFPFQPRFFFPLSFSSPFLFPQQLFISSFFSSAFLFDETELFSPASTSPFRFLRPLRLHFPS